MTAQLAEDLIDLVSAYLKSQKGQPMYGLIFKLTAAPGKRAELVQILSSSAANMPGCLT